MGILKLDKAKIYYEDIGMGDPIVFLHGSLSTCQDTFGKQISFFQSSYRCICPDLRCHGKSEYDSDDWNTELLARDTSDIINLLDLSRVRLIGHSMGGDIALTCAIRFPNQVASVTVISDGADVNDNINSYLGLLNPDIIDREKYKKFLSYMKCLYPEKWDDLIRQTIWNCSKYPSFTDEELEQISVPVLLIRGSNDKMVLDTEVERLCHLIPNTDYHLIENGDHFVHSRNETFNTVNKIIKQFLDNK